MDTGRRSGFRAQRNDCEEDRKLYSRRTRAGAGAGLDGSVAEEALATFLLQLWHRPVGLGSLTAVDATMARARPSSSSTSRS